ncbi:4Fe-4S dicluster domain-containing protein [Candidatus Bathyarchaeota archaeon]|nr:4Fe-4S dicluster domain-containing protein [Candidatus Bathyarchaeota archaeon]
MNLAEEVKSISGEDVRSCYQCGLCSGSCPVRSAMDLSPTQIIRLVQISDIERIFESNTFWICSTCFACQAICPRKINITKIMETLRQIRLRRDQDKISISEISKEELKILPPIALVSNFRKTTA